VVGRSAALAPCAAPKSAAAAARIRIAFTLSSPRLVLPAQDEQAMAGLPGKRKSVFSSEGSSCD
jgi:hypothetical protein